jgi:sugar transferase (PEP-CTERM/EpsH1 system associated)
MTSNKKKILFLTSRFPFPLEKGDKLRAYHQIKSLSDTYEVVLCSICRTEIKKEWIEELEQFCSEIHVFRLKKPLLLLNTFLSLFTSKPIQVGFFYQRWINKKIENIVESLVPDLIFCQLIRVSEYVKNIHSIPKVLDYMDALSSGMIRRSNIAKWPFKIVLNMEGQRLKRYENKIYDYFNEHCIISNEDRKLISHPNSDKIKIVPNGIDEYFLNYESILKTEFDLVFVGNLSYPPNVESCSFIVENILPYLDDKGVSLSLLISGASPSARVKRLGDFKNVTVSGWVDDIRESYCKGKVFVAPLFIGTGLQNKLLEAMALKVPCVTTSLVNNGLGATKFKHVLVADSVEEFANHILNILEDKEMSNKLAENAKVFVKNKYNWDASMNSLDYI